MVVMCTAMIDLNIGCIKRRKGIYVVVLHYNINPSGHRFQERRELENLFSDKITDTKAFVDTLINITTNKSDAVSMKEFKVHYPSELEFTDDHQDSLICLQNMCGAIHAGKQPTIKVEVVFRQRILDRESGHFTYDESRWAWVTLRYDRKFFLEIGKKP
jgi:hypothetical protein